MKQYFQFRHLVILLLTAASLFIFSCSVGSKSATTNGQNDEMQNHEQISVMLDSFNKAAAKADYITYFNFYTDDAIFTGTDATERWNKKEFMIWAKPFFDRGRAWNFTSIQRHIYFDNSGKFAWFDELLNTQMKICRGSGVVIRQGSEWKVAQYILSATVPNDIMNDVVKMKAKAEDSIINKLLHH